jgi:hypothetical protein
MIRLPDLGCGVGSSGDRLALLSFPPRSATEVPLETGAVERTLVLVRPPPHAEGSAIADPSACPLTPTVHWWKTFVTARRLLPSRCMTEDSTRFTSQETCHA